MFGLRKEPQRNLRVGKIKINGNIYDIEPRAILSGANLEGADLSHADLVANFMTLT